MIGLCGVDSPTKEQTPSNCSKYQKQPNIAGASVHYELVLFVTVLCRLNKTCPISVLDGLIDRKKDNSDRTTETT